MKSSIVLFMLSIHILPIFAEEPQALLTLSFPIFDSGNDELMVGYGDWCPPLEGPHPGIDFFADETDDVLNPFDEEMIVLGASYDASYPGRGCILGIGLIDEWWGWALKHLKHSGAPEIWCMNHPRGMNYAPRQPIEECIKYTGAPRHLHIDWSFWEEDLLWPGGARIPEGFHEFINPFDYFDESQLANYDQVSFKRVLYESYFNTGAWFMPDGTETPEQISGVQGNPDYAKFQNIVSGAIDIAISPYSSLVDYPDNVGAGVSAVGYIVLYQNPITLEWESTASSEGNWGFRKLFHSEGQTPWNENDEWDTDEYRASFADGNLTGGGGTQLMTLFESAYIVTNSGALDTVNWTTGWDNVWTDTGFVNDWTTGICQGAWDTNLQLPPDTGDAQTNADAFFPDGRYAVEVTAVSHGSIGSRDTGIDTLPVNDLSLDPSIEGVVVDNFLPHIQGVAVYAKKFGAYQLIYEGYWEDEALDGAISGESEYLEYLRENLHTLQSEDLSTALPSFCVIDLTESSNQSILNQIGFSESARTSEGYSDILSTLEPGCCLDEGIGQDPAEFLMEEIARVENRRFLIDFDNTTRVLTDTTYGYLTNNTERLILQVFYSEPTMTENSNGHKITDMLKFEGIIGSETEWRSSYYGQFGRLPGGFQLPLPTYDTVSSYSESGNTHYNESYSVYYVFKGTLPQEYVGHIQLYFGDTQTLFGGPLDLAGNKMDSYPGTVAEARSNYGPFSNQGYETGPDCNYVAGCSPDYYHNTSNDIVYGYVFSDLMVSIDLQTIGLEDGIFLGDCDYWCGFWMLDQTFGVNGFDVYIVKSDGTKIPYHFNEDEATYGNIEYPTTSDGRYLWLAEFFGNTPGTTGTNAIRIDAESGSVYHQNVCRGYSWIDGQDAYISCAQLVEVYEENDKALFNYGYWYTMGAPDSCSFGTVTLPSTELNEDFSLSQSLDDQSEVSESRFPVVEIQGNPISSNLGIICNSSTAQEYELVIYDISGRQVLVDSGVFISTDSRVDIGVRNLPSGVYLLRITTGDIEAMRTISIIH